MCQGIGLLNKEANFQSTNVGVCFYFCNRHKENFAFIPPIEFTSHSPDFLALQCERINPRDYSVTNGPNALWKLEMPSGSSSLLDLAQLVF